EASASWLLSLWSHHMPSGTRKTGLNGTKPHPPVTAPTATGSGIGSSCLMGPRLGVGRDRLGPRHRVRRSPVIGAIQLDTRARRRLDPYQPRLTRRPGPAKMPVQVVTAWTGPTTQTLFYLKLPETKLSTISL